MRRTAASADRDAMRQAKSKINGRLDDRNQEDIEQEPLMDGEVTMSQEGGDDGEARAYAHRDIKPG